MVRVRYHHGDLRRALVDAAVEILDEDGVEALTLRAVARRAGVSHQAPYYHFADKAALLAAVAEEGFRRLAERMAAVRARDPAARLQALGLAYVKFALERRARYRVMFGADRPSSPTPSLEEAAQQAFAALAEAVAAAGAEDPFAAAVAAWSAVHGLASLWLDGPLAHMTRAARRPSLEPLARAVTAALTRGIAGAPRRR